MSHEPRPQHQHRQDPLPSWESRGASHPRSPPKGGHYEGPTIAQAYPNQPSALGDMVTLPPPQSQQHQDLYHLPSYDMYPGHSHPAAYPPHPHDPHRDHPSAHMSFNQPAPRQRTAIACRYCRRRKIRCHGFDSSPDGRCTNCIRFHQECIFTPVSSQAHAFVPAHTAYPHLRNTGGARPIYTQEGQPVIYGAHGQPLGPIPPQGQDPNYPPPMAPGYAPGPYAGVPGAVYDDRGLPQPPHPQDQVSRKRRRSDKSPHPVLPPPPQNLVSPVYSQQRVSVPPGGRRGSGGGANGYEYPDPTQLAPVSPASSSASYQSGPYPQQPSQQPYYPPQPQSVRRSSPQSAYPYDAHTAGSPHGSTSSASGYTFPGGLHPPQVLPPTRESGHSPPPTHGREGKSNGGSNGSRAGMSVRDMLGPGDGQGGRTPTDSNMLNALNRRGM
ncbi:hypothetical protein MMC20_000502 [Loxospora ochrophaea]|nr:hypothetical protein [Loxospora ochrophaea]